MAVYNPPPKTPVPKDDQGADAPTLVRDYMFRQYWSLKWWFVAIVSFMSIYTISFERWVPFIGLTGFMSFLMVMLGIIAGGSFLNTEFLKAIRARQLGNTFDWSKVRYVAWGIVFGNLVIFYWLIVMAYLSWFAKTPVNIQ